MAQGQYAARAAPQPGRYDPNAAYQEPHGYGPQYDSGYQQQWAGDNYDQYNQNPHDTSANSYDSGYQYGAPSNGPYAENGNNGYGGRDQSYGNSLPYREKQPTGRPEMRGGRGVPPSAQNSYEDPRSGRNGDYGQDVNSPNGYNFSSNAGIPSPSGRQQDPQGRNAYRDDPRSPQDYEAERDPYSGGRRARTQDSNSWDNPFPTFPQKRSASRPREDRNGDRSRPGTAGGPQARRPTTPYVDERNPVRSGDTRQHGPQQLYQPQHDTRTPQRAVLHDEAPNFEAPASVTGFYGDQNHFQNAPRPGTAPSSSDPRGYQRSPPNDPRYEPEYGRPPMRREVSDSSAHPRNRQQPYGGYLQQQPPHESYATGPHGNSQHSYDSDPYAPNSSNRPRGDGVFEMPGDMPQRGQAEYGYSNGNPNDRNWGSGYDGYAEQHQYDSYNQGSGDYTPQPPPMQRNDTYDTSFSDPGPRGPPGGFPPAGSNQYGRQPPPQGYQRDQKQQLRPAKSREDMRRQRPPRDPRDARDRRDPRDGRPPRDARDPRSGRGHRNGADARDPRRPPPSGHPPASRNSPGYPPDDRQRQRRDGPGASEGPRDRARPDRGRNGEVLPPQPRSAGPTSNGYPPDTNGRLGSTSPYDRPSTAPSPSGTGRSPPQGPPGSNGLAKSGQPPVRPGLQQSSSTQPARPPPVRNYNMNSSQPSESASSKEKSSRRKSEPITQDTLTRLRSQANANPNDNQLQMKLATSLVEASKVLADEGGRADPATRSRNSKRYASEALQIVRKLSAASYPDAMFYLADSYSTGSLGLDNDP